MVKKIIDLLRFSISNTYEDKIEYLQAFKELYGEKPYYVDLKSSILSEIDLLGLLDYDTSNETLSID